MGKTTSFAEILDSAAKQKEEQEQVYQFITQKMSKAMCMVCGIKKWQIVDGIFDLANKGSIGSNIFNPFASVFSRNVPVICVVCEDCGNMLPFSVQFIQNKIKDQNNG